MLYYFFEYLEQHFDFFGAGVFQYISFRASMAMVFSLLISLIYGKKLINFLRKKQVGESVRELGLAGQVEKTGTPTMGGIMILISIIIPTLLFARLSSVYIIILLIATVWMAIVGFIDDYIKVFKKNKEGLHGKFKIIGQIGIGIVVGLILYFNKFVVVREYVHGDSGFVSLTRVSSFYHDVKSMITSIPFLKDNEFDYNLILGWLNPDYTWAVYVLVVVFIITAVSNGANITDGIDGLAAGTSAIIGLTLMILAYLSGNAIFADYLNIMYIPNSGELVIYCAAFTGACIGFLWYNSYPAQIFMGDTGSLMLGGCIATMALCLRKELLIPVLCGIFLIENLSVMLQVSYFKYQKKKHGIEYARANRLFRMSPLHHHYQKGGFHESKIVIRFLILGVLLSIVTLATLKLR
ncbi:MAG: phospho-N-acetylmuramoyl-pentapeptide-transferase [Opitutaceae bacterium]|nr:phospho-N-acetylmuramoyl-pentapeptide-transferase [Cytophagales bacterium]